MEGIFVVDSRNKIGNPLKKSSRLTFQGVRTVFLLSAFCLVRGEDLINDSVFLCSLCGHEEIAV